MFCSLFLYYTEWLCGYIYPQTYDKYHFSILFYSFHIILSGSVAIYVHTHLISIISPFCLTVSILLFFFIRFFISYQQSFSYKGIGLPGLNQYLARINVLNQGHNTVTPVRLEPSTLRSRVKHSTTEPLRFLLYYTEWLGGNLYPYTSNKYHFPISFYSFYIILSGSVAIYIHTYLISTIFPFCFTVSILY